MARVFGGRFVAVPMLAGALLVQGCAGGVSRQDVGGYDDAMARGNYRGAAQLAMGAGQIAPDGRSQNLLWSLGAGSAMVHAGEGAQTIPVLDQAEEMMKSRDLATFGDGQYHAKTYDGVMVNAYKAIAAMEIGDSNIARSELRRADERQNRAEQDFQKEVAAQNARNAGGGDVDLRGGVRSAQASPDYQAALRDMSNYGGYAPFINPFATYLTGLYLLNTADSNPEQARVAFTRVRGIVGPSPLLNGDIGLAQSRRRFPPKVWVIFENGQSSTLSEYSFQIPIPIVGRHSGVSTVRVAMPRLHENAAASRGLLVGDQGAPTTVVGNFDYVQRSEFARRYPSIVTAAVAEVAIKAVAQNLAAQEKSGLLLIATAVASQVSTADTRSWTSLPKEFQAARIETPKSGQVALRTAEGADLGTATVPTDASCIVYVKALRPGSPPAIQVLRF